MALRLGRVSYWPVYPVQYLFEPKLWAVLQSGQLNLLGKPYLEESACHFSNSFVKPCAEHYFDSINTECRLSKVHGLIPPASPTVPMVTSHGPVTRSLIQLPKPYLGPNWNGTGGGGCRTVGRHGES